MKERPLLLIILSCDIAENTQIHINLQYYISRKACINYSTSVLKNIQITLLKSETYK